jgi:ferrochelatase
MPSPQPRPPVGVILAQLGTPAAPTAAALRPYLRQFLSDRRVIETPRAVWFFVLNLAILPFRPPRSAEKYRRIWSAEHGSPIRHYTERQASLAGQALGPGTAVVHAMRYGRPSLAEAVDGLCARGCDRVVTVPLYPQYAASSTASVYDDLFRALAARRAVPALHVVPPFFADPGYLGAVEQRCRAALALLPSPPDHVVISFHGLPVAMVSQGDPYRAQCEVTANLLARRLDLAPGRWSLTFQSRFGPVEWLQPYTDLHLVELARQGARSVLVVAPGFVSDCLETLDELGNEAAHAFRAAGGERLTLVPCLNDSPEWIAALTAIVRREAGPWLQV